jgi:glycosyltransferase involved in cell wall biosynthesis
MPHEEIAKRSIDTNPPVPSDAKDRPRLLIVNSHVIQYAAPNLRGLVRDARVDILVAYCSMQGAESGVDPEFGVQVSWDTPLLDGYPWTLVRNRATRPGLGRFFGLLNPGLWNLIRDGHFDAVLLPGYFYASAWIAIGAAKWHGVPIVFVTDSHGLQNWGTRSEWKIRVKKVIVPRIFSLAQAIVVSSSGGVEYLKSLGLPRESIVLAPTAVDNAWWLKQAAGVDRGSVRAGWRIPEGALVVLYCGKLQPWKRPVDLLEAFARADVRDSYLVFAGDGPEKKQLELRATELRLADRVRFLGFVNQSQLPSVYCSADWFVLPSLFDAFGLVVNEAMLCGLPVIISDRVGARFDLVRPNENGYVFPAGDKEALAAILREALPDQVKREQMGKAARHRMETWSPREYADSVVRAVQLVMKNKPAR